MFSKIDICLTLIKIVRAVRRTNFLLMEFVARSAFASDHSEEIIFGGPSQWEEKLSSRIGHTCQLDIDQVAEFPRATCIVCTLGRQISRQFFIISR